MQRTREFIPLIKPSVGEKELEEIRLVLESGWLAQGPKVKEFESKLASHLGAKHAIATSSCTTALSLAIESLRIPEKSEVIVPDFTFPATANVVIRAGARPVLADVHSDTYSINPVKFRRGTSKKTSAIMPVHPFGHPFEMDELYEIAENKGITVIEDAATAFGTKYKGRLVGSGGRAICLSFHPRKLLTTAEGGCLLTDDDEVYEKALALRSHGQVTRKGRAEFVSNGLNYRMSDVHAAIGLAQLRRIDSIIKSRRRQARAYSELLLSSQLDLQIPKEMAWAYHTYQSYVLVLGKTFGSRDKCIELLRSKFGIETQVGTYSLCVQEAFRSLASTGNLRNSRMLSTRSLTLPLYESLSEDQQAYVVDSLSKVAAA